MLYLLKRNWWCRGANANEEVPVAPALFGATADTAKIAWASPQLERTSPLARKLSDKVGIGVLGSIRLRKLFANICVKHLTIVGAPTSVHRYEDACLNKPINTRISLAMNSQRNLAPVSFFFGVFILCLSIEWVDGAKCSPINRYVSLSKKEKFCFVLSSSPDSETSEESEEQLDVTFLGVESHYFLPQIYTFFIPDVNVICECSCDVSSGTCTSNTYYKHDKCARHKSNSSVCTLLYKDGVDSQICTSAFKMCCQVYFSIPNTKGNKYYGLALNKHDNTMQMSLAINISSKGKERKYATYKIPNHVRSFLFDNDSLITLSVVSPNEALPDDWYYLQEGSQNLMTGHINTVGEQDFLKLGWFQMGRFGPDAKEELLSFDSQLLDQILHIYPLTCQSKAPQYEWQFDAKYYNKLDSAATPVVGKPAIQVHGRFVSNISIDVNKRSVIVDHRNPPELRLLVTKSEPILGELIYNGTVLLDKDSDHILRITFYSGKKITYLINIGNSQEDSEDFYASVYKSQSFPMEYSYRLMNRIAFPAWVCIYEVSETQKQLCQLVELSHEKYDEPVTADLQTQADNYKQRRDAEDNGYLMSLVILTLCLAIISLLVNAAIVYVYCRRRRHKSPLRSTNSFEKIKKDLRKDDRTDSDSTRYSHLYEYLHPTSTAKPTSNSTETQAV